LRLQDPILGNQIFIPQQQLLGMAYRTAWLLVEQINEALREPAVITATGGQHGGGTVLTSTGERVIELYHTIEELTRTSGRQEFRALAKVVRCA
jgi:molybdate transport system regulatory protein